MLALRLGFQCIFLVFCLTNAPFPVSGNIQTKLKYFETLKAADIHVITKRSIDTNPQAHLKFVNLKGLGRDFSFYLQTSPSILTSDFKAVTVDAYGRKTPISVNKNSFYSGALRDEPNSHVEATWENDNLLATISVPNEIYTVEPAWRHLPYSTNHSMIIYKASDVIKSFKNSRNQHHRICGFKRGVTVSEKEYEDSLAESAYYRTSGSENRSSAAFYQHEYHQSKRRSKRYTKKVHNTCELMVVADYKFYSGVGNKDLLNTANYLIHILRKVDTIYRTTLWDEKAGLINYGIKIKYMSIHREYSNHAQDYNYNKTWEITPLLQAFSRKLEFNKYCLAHLFTYQKFNDGVLGLAYIASSRRNTYGGICSPLYRKQTSFGVDILSLNTGWSSSMNTYGARILTQEADLVTAHEIGHNWGSEHDPGEGRCAPSSFDNGKFIMYPYAVSGYETNNQKFSPCSKKYISNVLKSKAYSCFSVMEEQFSFCGDGKVNASRNEECDPGFLDEHEDPCCTDKCLLKPQAKCSPANHECCTKDCRISKKGEICRSTIGHAGGCVYTSFCDGMNLVCPEAAKKPDNTPCLDKGKCFNGVCLSYCESRDMQPCICDNITDACRRCCMHKGVCKPINYRDNLPNGRPCVQGYCVQGVCKKAVKNLVHRLFSIFEIITSDRLVEFMKSNIVGTVIVFSLILWIPSSCVVSYYDKKQASAEQKKVDWMSHDNRSLYANDDSSLRVRRTESYKQRFIGAAKPSFNYPDWNPQNLKYEQETSI